MYSHVTSVSVSLTYNMEQIYKPDNYNGTKHINFKEYFKEYSSLVFDFQKVTKPGISNDIFATMGCDFDNEQKKMLIDACSIDHLTVQGEKEPANSKFLRLFQPFEITKDAEKLETVKQFKKRQEERRKDFLCDPRLPEIDKKVEAVPKVAEVDLTPGKDFVVYVRLFRPFEYTYGETNTETLKFDQEIALLGTNTLADFRDKIGCTTDLTDCTDKSDDIKNLESFELNVTPYPSGFIFIDDTFYNDFRQSDSLDYSEVIRQWAKGKGIGPFRTAEMKDIQIQDLTPRMSYPYVYQHHGRCEHIFIFSHARLLNHEDKLHSSAYPFYSNACFYKNVYCMICGLIPAAWLVTDYDRLSRDQAPLCKHCLVTYCYVNGQKVGKFGVYPYMNRTTTIL